MRLGERKTASKDNPHVGNRVTKDLISFYLESIMDKLKIEINNIVKIADEKTAILLLRDLDNTVNELLSNYKYRILTGEPPVSSSAAPIKLEANTIRQESTTRPLEIVKLTKLERELYDMVKVLGIAYTNELSTLLKKPRNMISAYLKRLHEKGILVQMRIKTRHVAYMPIKLGITALLLQHQGEATIQQVANELDIPEHNIRTVATELASNNIIRIEGDKIILNKIKPKLIIFEWGGVLVDDSDFDEKLCEKLAERAWERHRNRYRSKDHARVYLRSLLDELESSGDKRWYDYYYLAEQLGVPREEVDKLQEEIFKEEGTKLLKLTDNYIPRLLNILRSRGINIYIITRGHSEINWQRAKLLGLHKYITKEEIIGSNIIKENDISTRLPFIREVLERTRVEPNQLMIVTSDAYGTIIPAINDGINAIYIINKTRPIYQRGFFGSPNIGPPHGFFSHSMTAELDAYKIYATMHVSLIEYLIER